MVRIILSFCFGISLPSFSNSTFPRLSSSKWYRIGRDIRWCVGYKYCVVILGRWRSCWCHPVDLFAVWNVEKHSGFVTRYRPCGNLPFICVPIAQFLQKSRREELGDIVNRMCVAVIVIITVSLLFSVRAFKIIPFLIALLPQIPKDDCSITSRRAQNSFSRRSGKGWIDNGCHGGLVCVVHCTIDIFASHQQVSLDQRTVIDFKDANGSVSQSCR